MIDGDLQQLGDELREAREAQALSLEEVEAQTRIRVKFLEALEEGDLSVLPSAMHAKGFLRSYAQFLRLDVKEVVAQFNAATGAGEPVVTTLTAEPAPPGEPLGAVEDPGDAEAPDDEGEEVAAESGGDGDGVAGVAGGAGSVEEAAAEPEAGAEEAEAEPLRPSIYDRDTGSLVPPPEIRRTKYVAPEQWVGPAIPAALRRSAQPAATAAAVAPPEGRPRPTGVPSRVLRSNLFIAAVLALGLLGIVWWVTTQLSTLSGDELAPGQQPAAVALTQAGEDLTPSPTFRPTSTPSGQSGPQIMDRVVLSMDVVQSTWVSIEVDGELQFEGQAVPGEVLRYEGREEVLLRAGNGAGLVVNYNGQDLGPLGERGEIVERIFRVDGFVTPTGTPMPTATSTGVPTATPRATLTPTPSPTP